MRWSVDLDKPAPALLVELVLGAAGETTWNELLEAGDDSHQLSRRLIEELFLTADDHAGEPLLFRKLSGMQLANPSSVYVETTPAGRYRAADGKQYRHDWTPATQPEYDLPYWPALYRVMCPADLHPLSVEAHVATFDAAAVGVMRYLLDTRATQPLRVTADSLLRFAM
jgi:hypothetical protein